MNFKDYRNDWLTAANTKNIGPEIVIGCIMGEVFDAPTNSKQQHNPQP